MKQFRKILERSTRASGIVYKAISSARHSGVGGTSEGQTHVYESLLHS